MFVQLTQIQKHNEDNIKQFENGVIKGELQWSTEPGVSTELVEQAGCHLDGTDIKMDSGVADIHIKVMKVLAQNLRPSI